MSIRVQDPLFLLSAQTGLSVGELQAEAAAGNPDVEKPQAALKTGEPIPIIFCRRRNSNGGVMVQPKMTEGYFANPIIEKELSTNSGSTTFLSPTQVTQLKYLLVLSEGCLPQLQIRDIFHGNCRRGTFNQTCNGRAGTWDPGNFIDDHLDYIVTPDANGLFSFDITSLTSGQSAKIYSTVYYRDANNTLHQLRYIENSFPAFCGTSGTYSGLTTLSFEFEVRDAQATKLEKTISVFVRKGLQLTRLIDGVSGESDNFVDLTKYLFQAGNRLADDLIDNTALTIAANFTDANGFFFNGELKKSQNLLDWLQATSVNFLLRLSNSGGKFGLLPRLPYNADYTIKTTQVTPEFTFTEEHVVDGGFELSYISLEDREPVCFVVQWRQQPEADFGLVRTVQVKYANEAANGPFVNIDMSNYCTNENHAVKVGAFRLAQRKFITHHLRLTVRERSYNASLVVGDLVRVRLRRETSEGEVEYHDKLYEINRIEKTFASTIVYDLTHFPIDTQGRSIVAREVAAATGAGNVINVGRTTFTCDENSSTATTTVGTASGGGGSSQPPAVDTEVDIDQPGSGDVDSPYPAGPSNPADPLDDTVDDTSALVITGSNTGYSGNSATPGNTLEVSASDLPCPDGRVCFYRLDKATGVKTLRSCVTTPVNGKFSSAITTDDINYVLLAEGSCPDPSSPDEYGPPIELGETEVVAPDPTAYTYVRWSGTLTTYVNAGSGYLETESTSSFSTQYYQHDGTTPNQYLTVGSAYGAFGNPYTYEVADPYLGTPPITSDFNVPLDWSPWVNYYNPITQQHVGTAGVVGVPWRAHVRAQGSRFTTSGGFGLRLGEIGGVGFNSVVLTPNPVPFGYTPAFIADLPADTRGDAPVKTARIDGVWEFSNDESTVLASWKGVDDNGDPYTD